MTQDPEHPAPSGPTPEEISARLEALLKRTHALRREQQAAGHDTPTWPPSDRDLASVEVVDVPPPQPAVPSTPDGSAARADGGSGRPPASPPGQASSGPGSGPGAERAVATGTSATSPVTARGAARAPAPDVERTPTFGQPDWSTLRMREPTVDAPRTPAWVWLLVAALVVALGLETAYLLRTRPWDASAVANDAVGDVGTATSPLTLHVDGPADLAISSGGGTPRTLPAEIAVEPGRDLRLVVQRAGSTMSAPAAPASAAGADAPAASSAAGGAAISGGGPSAAPAATTGAVHIVSTPPGAIVTLGGRERGPTPITVDGLRPGRHDVLVVGPAGGRLFRVDVTAGETARLEAVLPDAR